MVALIALVVFAGLILAISSFGTGEPRSANGPGPGKVWSEEHQHWH